MGFEGILSMEWLGLVRTPLGKARGEAIMCVRMMVGPVNGAEVPVGPKALLMIQRVRE